ncbi:MAG: replication protein [Patescibacteria group bacterium]|nr:replication protein [Patescibacteria group bacterium]MDE2438684.1 replication protein [Patescibacteria group bacterium]
MEQEKTPLIPNSTQLPNIILDFVVPLIPEAEARCLIYICRRTFGFHKSSDRISFSQFMKGIKDRRGNILDYGTGLSRQAVSIALKHLVSAEAVRVAKSRKGNHYQINLHMDVDKVVNLVDQSRKLTRNSLRNRPKPVYQVDTQNLGNKEKSSIRDPVENLSPMIQELSRKMTIN